MPTNENKPLSTRWRTPPTAAGTGTRPGGRSLSFGGMNMEETTAAVEKEFGEAPPRYLLERMAQFYPPRLTCPCGLELWGSGYTSLLALYPTAR